MHFAPSNDGDLLVMTNATAMCAECHTLANRTTPAAHLSSTNGLTLWPGGQYGSTFPQRANANDRGSCMNCHNPHGWPNTTNTTAHYPKLLADFEENLCFTCHDTNGPALKNVKDDFAKARRHPIGDSDTLRRVGRSVECSDCHNAHQALVGSHTYTNTATPTRNLVSNPLKGVSGVAVNYTGLGNFVAPGTNLYMVIPKSVGATNEYQICFKCHTAYAFGSTPPPSLTPVYNAGTAAFTNGLTTVRGTGTSWGSGMVGLWIFRNSDVGTAYRITAVANATNLTVSAAYVGASASGQAYTISGQTDLAQEFSPMNRSGHPIVTGLTNYPNSTAVGSPALKGLQRAALKAPWNVDVGRQTMMCSDCHNTDGASAAAQGPHGSAAQYMLRGANAANWPNVANSSFNTSWCANCHNNTTSSVHGGDHSSTRCYVCHIVIPHGGKVSRLMADNNSTMPARYAYNNNISNVGMQQFRKAASNGYTENNNCRTSCGHHGSGTGNEDW
jgi:predicted CXXCH cytochrome family protein